MLSEEENGRSLMQDLEEGKGVVLMLIARVGRRVLTRIVGNPFEPIAYARLSRLVVGLQLDRTGCSRRNWQAVVLALLFAPSSAWRVSK